MAVAGTLVAAVALTGARLVAAADVSAIWPLPRNLGPTSWTVLGPFPTSTRAVNRLAIDTDYLTALGGEANAVLSPTSTATSGQAHFRAREATLDHGGVLDLVRLYQTDTDSKVAYAYAEMSVPSATNLMAVFGSDDSAAVWVNGRRVHRVVAGRPLDPDADRFVFPVVAGPNRILVKVENGSGGWGFALRLLDEEGQRRASALKARRDVNDLEFGPRDKNFRLGDAFPEIGWADPEAARLVFVSTAVVPKWFDQSFDAVTAPTKPGRYFAVIESPTRDGLTHKRILTFVKIAALSASNEPTENLARIYRGPLSEPPSLTGRWPFALNDAQARELSRHMWWATAAYLERGERAAIAAASIADLGDPALTGGPAATRARTKGAAAESPSRPRSAEVEPDWLESGFIRNAELQLGLRMKLEGRAPKPFAPPEHLRVPAPVLRTGSERAAGLAPGTVANLREVARRWRAEDPEPLVILVARRGVIFMHEGFGTQKDAPFYPASIGKMIAGLTFARAVEQGLIGFDDPVATALPDWKDPRAAALTYRQCFAHLSGLRGHASHDGLFNAYLDNALLVGDAVFAAPGRHFYYNGDDVNLAGKALELTTGRSMWRLLYEHMQRPFGETVTQFDLGFGGAFTASYLAKVGQMILQDGTYGPYRFFRPGFLATLRPRPLSSFAPLADDPAREEGIAQSWMLDATGPRAPEVLGPHVLGHGAASGAAWRIALDHQLVVVIGRNRKTDHRTNDLWIGRFMKVLADGLSSGRGQSRGAPQ